MGGEACVLIGREVCDIIGEDACCIIGGECCPIIGGEACGVSCCAGGDCGIVLGNVGEIPSSADAAAGSSSAW